MQSVHDSFFRRLLSYTHLHITTEHFLLVDYFSRFWWLAGWAVDPRSGEVLLPFHDLPPQSRTFGPGRILPCLLDQLAPRVATKKNGTRVLPGLGSTPGKWSCWRPVELLHREWCYSSSSMRHLLPTLNSKLFMSGKYWHWLTKEEGGVWLIMPSLKKYLETG